MQRPGLARGLLQVGRQSNGERTIGCRRHGDVQDDRSRRTGQGRRTSEMTMREIHPQAVVAANAKPGEGVKTGAYAVVGEDVELGDACVLHTPARRTGPPKFGTDKSSVR